MGDLTSMSLIPKHKLPNFSKVFCHVFPGERRIHDEMVPADAG